MTFVPKSVLDVMNVTWTNLKSFKMFELPLPVEIFLFLSLSVYMWRTPSVCCAGHRGTIMQLSKTAIVLECRKPWEVVSKNVSERNQSSNKVPSSLQWYAI